MHEQNEQTTRLQLHAFTYLRLIISSYGKMTRSCFPTWFPIFSKKKWWQSIKNWYSYDILKLWNSHKKFSFGDEFCMDISHNTTIIRSHSLMTTLCVTSQRVLGSILVVGIFFETSFFFAFLRKLLQTYSFWLIMDKLRLLQRLLALQEP